MKDITLELSETILAVMCVVFILIPVSIVYEFVGWILGNFGVNISEI